MRQRILLVDDDPYNLKNLAYFLRVEGYEVDAASNGSDAARILKTDEFDLLLSDVIMPGLDGFHLLQYTRSIAPNMPVLLMSGSPDIDSNEVVKRGGAGFIMKPLELDQLLSKVKIALERQDCRQSS
jgi:two-component system response regulator GlrR